MANELTNRGWSQRELGRQAGVSGAMVSEVVNGRPAGWDFCAAIAKPLDKTPLEMFQLAGLLQKGDVGQARAEYYARSLTDEEARLIELYRSLPAGFYKEWALTSIRVLLAQVEQAESGKGS